MSLITLEDFRREFFAERTKLEKTHGIDSTVSVLNTKAVETSYLVKDRLNSFTFPYGQGVDQLTLPTFFHEAELKIKVGELLAGRLSGALALPADRPVTLHLVVDYSFSMKQHLKLKIAASAANYLADKLPKLLGNTQVFLYAFSDTCRRIDAPFTGKDITKNDTHYASFMRQVLRHRDRGRHNKLVLITDGIPSDFSEAMKTGKILQKAGIDYTQIMLSMSERFEEITDDVARLVIKDRIVDPHSIPEGANKRQYSDSEVAAAHKRVGDTFTSIADACNGNQIIMKVDPALRVMMVESFDRYMGLLSIVEGIHKSTPASQEVSEKLIRPWKWDIQED